MLYIPPTPWTDKERIEFVRNNKEYLRYLRENTINKLLRHYKQTSILDVYKLFKTSYAKGENEGAQERQTKEDHHDT